MLALLDRIDHDSSTSVYKLRYPVDTGITITTSLALDIAALCLDSFLKMILR